MESGWRGVCMCGCVCVLLERVRAREWCTIGRGRQRELDAEEVAEESIGGVLGSGLRAAVLRGKTAQLTAFYLRLTHLVTNISMFALVINTLFLVGVSVTVFYIFIV